MRCARRSPISPRPPEPAPPAARRSRGAAAAARAGAALLLALAAGAAAPDAVAQERWLLQGLLDAQYWNTDGGSRLLARNEGDRSGYGNLRLWAAGDFAPGLQGFAMASAYSGDACTSDVCDSDIDLEQAWLRYTTTGTSRFMVEAGRILTPIGDFPKRYLSSTNPLIDVPSDYSVDYPEGIKLGGFFPHADVTVAAVNLPLYADWYAPQPAKSYRPMLGAGWTPMVGLRFAAFATQGTYLGEQADASLPTGESWQDFDQSAYGMEVQFSRGHFELHGQLTLSAYEAPGFAERARGKTYWVEPRYTFTPRLYAALRVGQNDYPYIMPIYGTTWIASNSRVADVEAGVGVNVLPGLIVKASYRRDKWWVPTGLESLLPAGHAFAVAASWKFDLRDLVQTPH
ncbi:MAG TPA: hypothetical protein VMQ62_12955 [Dongiaceae bacterium]|nr:hypothetical protein [Dongiaceae bacterium]